MGKFAGISVVSLTFSPLSKEKNPDSKLKDYIMEDELAVDVEKLKGIIKLATSNDNIVMIKENERL